MFHFSYNIYYMIAYYSYSCKDVLYLFLYNVFLSFSFSYRVWLAIMTSRISSNKFFLKYGSSLQSVSSSFSDNPLFPRVILLAQELTNDRSSDGFMPVCFV